MDDQELLDRIAVLVAEEHDLEKRRLGVGLRPDDHTRLAELDVEIDRSWDLLRQRRARRRAGQDPDEAEPRPGPVVEHYQQ